MGISSNLSLDASMVSPTLPGAATVNLKLLNSDGTINEDSLKQIEQAAQSGRPVEELLMGIKFTGNPKELVKELNKLIARLTAEASPGAPIPPIILSLLIALNPLAAAAFGVSGGYALNSDGEESSEVITMNADTKFNQDQSTKTTLEVKVDDQEISQEATSQVSSRDTNMFFSANVMVTLISLMTAMAFEINANQYQMGLVVANQQQKTFVLAAQTNDAMIAGGEASKDSITQQSYEAVVAAVGAAVSIAAAAGGEYAANKTQNTQIELQEAPPQENYSQAAGGGEINDAEVIERNAPEPQKQLSNQEFVGKDDDGKIFNKRSVENHDVKIEKDLPDNMEMRNGKAEFKPGYAPGEQRLDGAPVDQKAEAAQAKQVANGKSAEEVKQEAQKQVDENKRYNQLNKTRTDNLRTFNAKTAGYTTKASSQRQLASSMSQSISTLITSIGGAIFKTKEAEDALKQAQAQGLQTLVQASSTAASKAQDTAQGALQAKADLLMKLIEDLTNMKAALEQAIQAGLQH